MTWTKFFDMSSGGSNKEKWNSIFIEAPEEEAKVIFYNRFGHNPDRVTCTCCGPDYLVYEDDPPSGNELASSGCLIIPASEIKPEEREGNIPVQGYIWVN